MKQFTKADILSWEPYLDLEIHFPEGWQGNVLDVLDAKHISFRNRLAIICRSELIGEKLAKNLADWCAKQIEERFTLPAYAQESVWSAAYYLCELSIRFAARKATREAFEKGARLEGMNSAWKRAEIEAELLHESYLKELIAIGPKTGDIK